MKTVDTLHNQLNQRAQNNNIKLDKGKSIFRLPITKKQKSVTDKPELTLTASNQNNQEYDTTHANDNHGQTRQKRQTRFGTTDYKIVNYRQALE